MEKNDEACGGVGSTKTGRLYFRSLLSMGISSHSESPRMSNIGCRAQQQFADVAASAEAWVGARHLFTPLLGGAGTTKHLLLQGRLLGNYFGSKLRREHLELAVSWQVLTPTEATVAVPSFAGCPGASCTPFMFQSWPV